MKRRLFQKQETILKDIKCRKENKECMKCKITHINIDDRYEIRINKENKLEVKSRYMTSYTKRESNNSITKLFITGDSHTKGLRADTCENT